MTRNELIKLWAKVTGKFDALIAGAPEALDTLKEIADKLGDDDDALAGLLREVAGKADAPLVISGISGQGGYVITKRDFDAAITAHNAHRQVYLASYGHIMLLGVHMDARYKYLLFCGASYDGIPFASVYKYDRDDSTLTDDSRIAGESFDLQKKLTFDSAPTSGSSNPVTSGGVYTALQGKQDDMLLVTITQSGTDLVADVAVSEIVQAISAGRDVLAVYGIGGRLTEYYKVESYNQQARTLVWGLVHGIGVKTLSQTGTSVTLESKTFAETSALQGKQDTISDLATIRSGAALGATAYQKPSGGIPKSDLASAVQTSLGKADTALQSFTESDPTVPSHVKSITQANIASWNTKQDVSPITNAASGALTVNEYRDFGSVSALTVTLSGGTMANYDLYKFAFTCASDSTTLTLPSGVKLPVDMEMEMATGRRFECVIDYANCLTFNCWD